MESTTFGDAASADGFDQWRRICADNFIGDEVWTVGDPVGFSGEFQRRWVDDLLIVRFDTREWNGRIHARSDAADYIGFVTSPKADGESFRLRDRSTHEVDSAMGVWDNGSIAEYSVHAARPQTQVLIPKRALQGTSLKLGRLAAPIGVAHRPSARILSDLLAAVLAQSDAIALSDAVAIRHAILDLVVGSAAETAVAVESTGAVTEAMRQRVVGWIAEHLPGDEVSPAAAAAAHGISLRSLHRLFSDEDTTFGEVVRGLRLERVRQDLLQTSGTVQAIAARWGYADVSGLCRDFKRAYGVTATAYRNEVGSGSGTGQQGGGTPGQLPTFKVSLH